MAVNLRWLDRSVTAGLIFLLGVSALFFGSVHRWAYSAAEMFIALMVVAWAVRISLGARPGDQDQTGESARGKGGEEGRSNIAYWGGIATPIGAFILLLIFQLTPLPPGVMRLLSPATYHFYELSFPGWPRARPYAELERAHIARARPATPVFTVLPSAGFKAGARAITKPGAKAPRREPREAAPGQWLRLRWRALALAPGVTWSALIEVFACTALFFIVLTYPFGARDDREAEVKFLRTMLIGLIAVAAAVALIGMAERLAWNGKILWVFVPHDWGAPDLSIVRASGPFVDPDHFADYLAMVLPLALAGALFPFALIKKARREDFRLVCIAAALLIGAGVMLSLSRGGWVAAAFAIWLMLTLSLVHAREQAPAILRRFNRRWPVTLAIVVVSVIALLMVVGPAGRESVASRVSATITQNTDLNYRPAIWHDSLGMIRDYPLFGVGLGCWPEIFNHYLRPPWIPFFYRQAENDYLQFMAETGLAGVALLIWFAWLVIGELRRGAHRLAERQWPIYAGMLAGLAAVGLHEFVDFSLRTPANAFLFTVLLALCLRFAARGARHHPLESPRRVYLTAAGAVIAALALMMAAFSQPPASYPSDIDNPATFTAAERTIGEHPASSSAHLAMVRTMGSGALAAVRLEQLRAAVWLDPNSPYARDLYARNLAADGNRPAALAQIALSMFHSPRMETHYYLAPQVIPWLLPSEQNAIESGLKQALHDRMAGALETLANFYGYVGRYSVAADEYARMAARTTDPAKRLPYLLAAGKEYANAGKLDQAEIALKSAAEIAPADPRPYAQLAHVLCMSGGVNAARPIIARGISEGAPPYALYMALAGAAQSVGDKDAAEHALLKALSYEPDSFAAVMKLGSSYMRENKTDRALLEFRQATELDPHSAAAFLGLGQAAEASFYYHEAGQAYARAAALEPKSAYLQQQYADFQERTAKSATELQKNQSKAAAGDASVTVAGSGAALSSP
ncbi:MAG: O-antigen ligase family protein [Candidatus Binataceae bacterium]